MKQTKKYLFTMVLLFCCLQMMSQTNWFKPLTPLDDAKLIVTYTYTFHVDSTDLNKSDSEWMILLIGNKISNFQSYGCYEGEKIERQKNEEGVLFDWYASGDFAQYATSNVYYIYKNYPEGKITTIDRLFLGDTYEYEEDINPFVWQISEDTVRIEGYLCQKAVCDFGGRTWEAWFTNELPYSDGPYKFGGLPGLILNIADTRNHYSFEFRSIESLPEGEKITWEEEDNITTTKEKFFITMKSYYKAPVADKITDDAGMSKIDAELSSRNNPIELEW